MSRSLTRCDIEIAKAALVGCVPGASISPDHLYSAAKAAGFELSFERIVESESKSKCQLFDAMFANQAPHGGRVFVIADCVLPDCALVYEGEDLRTAIIEEGSFLFDGDVMFVWPSLRSVTVFHHEGGYFHIRPWSRPSTKAQPFPRADVRVLTRPPLWWNVGRASKVMT